MNGPARIRSVREVLSRRAAKRRLAEWGITVSLPTRWRQGMWVDVPCMKIASRCHIVLVDQQCAGTEHARACRYRFSYRAPANPLRG